MIIFSFGLPDPKRLALVTELATNDDTPIDRIIGNGTQGWQILLERGRKAGQKGEPRLDVRVPSLYDLGTGSSVKDLAARLREARMAHIDLTVFDSNIDNSEDLIDIVTEIAMMHSEVGKHSYVLAKELYDKVPEIPIGRMPNCASCGHAVGKRTTYGHPNLGYGKIAQCRAIGCSCPKYVAKAGTKTAIRLALAGSP